MMRDHQRADRPSSPGKMASAVTACVALVTATLVALGPAAATSRPDTTTLKSGLVYRGTLDRDNTIVSIFDGVKRVILREVKIAKTEPDASLRNLETFRLVQPLEKHAGAMPAGVLSIAADSWNEKGRREFLFLGPGARKPTRMMQAINELGPYLSRYRGVDGFWQGVSYTNQIPRSIVVGLLGRVERTDSNERLRVGRFLIQAQWYPEALRELDSLEKDFPALRDTIASVRTTVIDLQATQRVDDARLAIKVKQPRAALAGLKAIDQAQLEPLRVEEIQKEISQQEEQARADRVLADSLRATFEHLSESQRTTWNPPLVEILKDLSDAPDARRDRLAEFQKLHADDKSSDEARLAAAFSGWVLGADSTVTTLEAAELTWLARDTIRDYLRSTPNDRDRLLTLLLGWNATIASRSEPSVKLDLALLIKLVRGLTPPLHDGTVIPEQARTFRVLEDTNLEPTEYTVVLPPEYHPARSYPAVVVLHDGRGVKSAVEMWQAETRRRGYILIAPEFMIRGQPPDYRYSESEHAAVTLSLRDALKRFAIDSDRVGLVGQILGGQMALDFGLAHPDLFRGVASISGMPAKHVFIYRNQAELLPMYMVLGGLTPAAEEVGLNFAKGLMLKYNDVTFVDYPQRGPEDFPEEIGPVLDWMDRQVRQPFPRKFDVVTARNSDDRFYGVVIREFAAGFAPAPATVDVMGKGLKPATIEFEANKLGNLIRLTTKGLKRLDVWVSPEQVDFQKRIEVRLNGKSYYKAAPKPELEPLLEDLRLRGDRKQIYGFKVPIG